MNDDMVGVFGVLVCFGFLWLMFMSCENAMQKSTIRHFRRKANELEAKLKLTEELAAMLYGIAVKSSDADAADAAKTVTQRLNLQKTFIGVGE